VREVGGRRDRLADEARRGKAGPLGGVGQQPDAPRSPRGRVRQGQLPDTPGDPGGLGGDPAEHRGEQVPYGYHGLAEQDHVVVDAALRVGFEPLRAAARQVGRVAPGLQPPVRSEQHRRRQQRRAVEQQRPDPAVGPLQHRDRGGGAEVHGEAMLLGRGHGREW
jgi:hypothetical protein